MSAVALASVPAELRSYRQWVVYRMPGKVPRQAADPSKNAASDNPATWGTFAQAVAAVEAGGADGIGFVFTPDDPYIGMDLDDCVDRSTGELGEVVAQVVADFATYTEVSPSKTGLHAIFRGEMPAGAGRVTYLHGQKFEIFPEGKYFTMTGRLLGDVMGIRGCQPQLDALCAKLWPKKEEDPPPRNAAVAPIGDQELIEMMSRSRSGPEIDALLRGDPTARNGDPSANDLSACIHLAWWTNGDDAQMDRIFRGSGRMRDKWDEPHYADGRTYGQGTIEMAIAKNGGKGYSGGASTGGSQRERSVPAGPPPSDPSLVLEAAHAAILAGEWRDIYRWSQHEGAWRHWTGRVWRKVSEPVVVNSAQKVLRAHYGQQLAQRQSAADDKRLRELHKLTCRHASVLCGLAFLKGEPGFHTDFEQWDADAYALNCADGLLDLRTQRLRLHDPAALCTKMARWSFAGTESTGAWERHLRRCLPDDDIRRQVQRDLGRALVGTDLEESLPIWYGIGANGKSTTARTVLQGVDEYGKQAVKDLLVATKFERHTTDLADLAGSRIVIAEEVEDGKRLDEATVKNLTGGNRKKARFMRGDNFEFEQTFSIFELVNHRPVISGTDVGIWRRLRLVPWTESIPYAEQRPQDEMVAELMVDGSWMLRWMVAGFADWQADHHWIAEPVEVATAAYRAEQDILAGFLSRKCVLNPHATISVDELHEAYMIDLMEFGDEGIERLSKVAFGKRLKSRNLSQGRDPSGTRRVWRGIGLLTTSDKSSGSSL